MTVRKIPWGRLNYPAIVHARRPRLKRTPFILLSLKASHRYNPHLPTELGIIRNKMIECTFHPFPRLPTEIRVRIWEMTVEPRTVELHCIHKNAGPTVLRRFSPTPAPATMHACRASRNHLYAMHQQVFLKDAVHCGVPDGTAQQYVWLDWDIDTVSIGTSLLACFESVALLIRKLKFERDNADEWWCRFESQQLRDFKHLEMIHVVCQGGDMEDWHATSEDYPWPCGPENVFIMDQSQTMRLTEVEDKYDRQFEKAAREADPSSEVTFRNGNAIYPHY